MSANHQLAI